MFTSHYFTFWNVFLVLLYGLGAVVWDEAAIGCNVSHFSHANSVGSRDISLSFILDQYLTNHWMDCSGTTLVIP